MNRLLYTPTVADATTGTATIYADESWDGTGGATVLAQWFGILDSWKRRDNRHRDAGMAGGHKLKAVHARVPKKALVLRTSYQGMCRLPCYRGVRPR